MRKILFCLGSVITFFYTNTLAQKNSVDSTQLVYYFANGEWEGQVRNYLMATDNQDSLTDYYANALGVTLGYQTKAYKGFSAGIKGSFVYNTWSSDFTILDEQTGGLSRYELGLFDANSPNQPTVYRLDELFLQYKNKQVLLRFGKQKLNTPWINPQDGRMQPNYQEGLWGQWKVTPKTTIIGSWLYAFQPRSTGKWFNIGESIGQYPVGRDVMGKRSLYRNNTQSEGIAIFSVQQILPFDTKLEIWNYWIENVMNTTLIELEGKITFKNKANKLIWGVQYHLQNKVGEGGNSNNELAYKPNNEVAQAISGRIGFVYKQSKVTFNTTFIDKEARFLFPREWGRDPFYTFMPRERNEGLANTVAFVTHLEHHFKKINVKLGVGYGHFYLPSAQDAYANKYAMPSYQQLNVLVDYQFSGILKGLESRLLYVYKGALGDTYDNPNFVFNKVNMGLINWITTFNF